VFYSGPRPVFDAHAPVLRLVGEPAYLGADPGLSQLFYQAHLDVFRTALSSLLMMGATAEHIVRTSEAAGVDAALPGAVLSHYDRAIAAGHAAEDWTVLYEVIKAGRPAAPPA
jgi:hypothetical protein